MVITMQKFLTEYKPREAEFYFCERCKKYRSPYAADMEIVPYRFYCYACSLNLLRSGVELLKSVQSVALDNKKKQSTTKKPKESRNRCNKLGYVKRQKQILELVKEHNFLTAKDLMDKLCFSKDTAYRLLRPMVEGGLVVKAHEYFIETEFWSICQNSGMLLEHIVEVIRRNGNKMTSAEIREYFKAVPKHVLDERIKDGTREGKWQRHRIGNTADKIIFTLPDSGITVPTIKEAILNLIRENPGISNRTLLVSIGDCSARNYYKSTRALKEGGLIYTKRTLWEGVLYYPVSDDQSNQLENQLEDVS